MSPAKSHYLDLNDYDLGHRNSEGKYHCPACGNQSLSRDKFNGTAFNCYKGCTHLEIRRAFKPKNEEYSAELQAKREAAQQARVEAERARVAALQSTAMRNADWTKILRDTVLSPQHRQDMLDRGHTEQSIAASGARSMAQGRYMPIRDYAGNVVGAQKADKGAKIWYGESGTNQLKETGELPLSIVYPAEKPQQHNKKNAVMGYIAYTESTGDKPWLLSTKRQYVVIGSSNIGSQPIDLKRSIEGIQAKYGWQETQHILMPDGGAIINKMVMANYAKLQSQLAELGHTLWVGWWGQYEKDRNDVDEIETERKIDYIEWSKFLQMAADYQQYKPLTALTVDDRFVQTIVYSTQYVQPFIPAPSTITIVSSPCATGKTYVLKKIIADHLAANPRARVIDIVHMNAIKEGHQARLGIGEWRTGYGQDEAAINSFPAISICPDSFLKLDLQSIPQKSLLILDEAEAVLNHVASGKTLGINAARAQQHLADIIERVLFGGGSVIALEDDLTDLTIEALHQLSGSQYDRILIKNDIKPSSWDISMGQGSIEFWLAEILNRLKAGERLFVPNTSQEFGQALELMVLELIPELAGKTVRLDRKTTSEHQDLMADPVKWLTDKDRDIRLFVCSPTIQSGFDIALWDYFSAVVMKASNLSTRAIIQMLNRVRSSCDRLIWTKKRGAEAGSGRKSVAQLEKAEQNLANEISLAHGYGRINNSKIGSIWNHLAAQFAVRDTLSACYLHDYLELNLKARGHDVTAPNWLGAEGWGDDLKEKFKQIKHQIKVDDNHILFKADGKALSLSTAVTFSHSSNVKWEVRLQALKTILHHRLPGIEFSEEFLMAIWTNDNGRYLRQIELAYMLKRPDLARLLDLQAMTAQNQGQPHIIYSQIPKTSARVDTLQPIVDDLLDLASGRDYDINDPAVARVNAWCLENSFQAYKLFQIHFNVQSIDEHGCIRNSAIANVNKVLRKIGFKAKSTRQQGTGKARIYIYQVENHDCEHRALVYKALDIKYKDAFETDKNIRSVAETLAHLTTMPVEEAREGWADLKLQWLKDLVNHAINILDPDQREKFRFLSA
jgi:hypothetical protein